MMKTIYLKYAVRAPILYIIVSFGGFLLCMLTDVHIYIKILSFIILIGGLFTSWVTLNTNPFKLYYDKDELTYINIRNDILIKLKWKQLLSLEVLDINSFSKTFILGSINGTASFKYTQPNVKDFILLMLEKVPDCDITEFATNKKLTSEDLKERIEKNFYRGLK